MFDPDIMYLNRQRVQAIQELGEMKREHKSLLEKMKHLESQTYASVEEGKLKVSKICHS